MPATLKLYGADARVEFVPSADQQATAEISLGVRNGAFSIDHQSQPMITVEPSSDDSATAYS